MTLRMMSDATSELTELVERVIRNRTGGQIRELRVDVFNGEVVLTGQTSTYYTKQLATHAALDAVEKEKIVGRDMPSLTLTNDIRVC
jgi:osmotically-inducible protein OsmY